MSRWRDRNYTIYTVGDTITLIDPNISSFPQRNLSGHTMHLVVTGVRTSNLKCTIMGSVTLPRSVYTYRISYTSGLAYGVADEMPGQTCTSVVHVYVNNSLVSNPGSINANVTSFRIEWDLTFSLVYSDMYIFPFYPELSLWYQSDQYYNMGHFMFLIRALG